MYQYWRQTCAKNLVLYSLPRSASPRIPRARPVHFKGLSTLPPTVNAHALQSLDILQTYRGLSELGKITFDENQVRVIMQLRRLQKELVDYAPPALTSHYLHSTDPHITDENPWWTHDPETEEIATDQKALVRVRTHAEDLAALTTPKGLLLTGPPGSGKTFLVDLWFNALPTPYKARKHYSELVLEIYRGVWEETQIRMHSVSHSTNSSSPAAQPWTRAVRDRWRDLLTSDSMPAKWIRRPDALFGFSTYSIPPTIAFVVAQRLILRHWLLVFDEIQLLDVSSATLLADVLSWFWRMGGVIVGTSNKVPDDLYKNGVQRERLEPFVEALKVRCPVLDLTADSDWREVRALKSISKTWYTDDSKEAFEGIIKGITAGEAPSSQLLSVFGRDINVSWSMNGTCKFGFKELCDESLGPADYLTIASTFRTVIITSVPVLKLSAKNQARRFISLIDALYEARCRLICLAEAEPDELFFPDATEDARHSEGTDNVDVLLAEAMGGARNVYRPNISSYDAPNMAEAPARVMDHASHPALETLSIFSGKDEQFAFKRALSRLLEMTSDSYGLEEQWSPLPAAARKWETSAQAPTALIARSSTSPNTRNQVKDDFASEAAYETHEYVNPSLRPESPRLREEHIWGVRNDRDEQRGRRKRKSSENIGGTQ